jgi:putative Mg2+ transporter-C (MgtC) family protein
MIIRLLVGVGLGTVIGFERQYRARGAGLRTNALVSAGSTLFVLLSANGFGIGFLGAGVIIRDGLNVRGLNTAATLWCSAAVGALAGAGMLTTALAGTVAVVVVNIALRAAGRAVDRQPDSSDEQPATYVFVAVTNDEHEAHVRALLVQALTRTDFRLVSVASANTDLPGRVEVRAELASDQRDDRQMESAVSRLSLESSVTSVGWHISVPETAGGAQA